MDTLELVKGHGTENDFLVVPDLAGTLDLTPELVRALCDRRAGLGADGVLRVLRTDQLPPDCDLGVLVEADLAATEFFMDYRNADGSIAEMCGNGARVFVRYLHRAGLAAGPVSIATRGGVRPAWSAADGGITVDMGPASIVPVRPGVTVLDPDGGVPIERPSLVALTVPNPHVVVELADSATLSALDLSRPPMVSPALPDGQNIEFIVREGERHLRMRVHERGVGETRSCGTGICAAVVAAARPAPTGPVDEPAGGPIPGDDSTWRVDVPGGTCSVTWSAAGNLLLTGPAVLVADIRLDPDWLA